jgi:sialic acid synthase SpsE
MFAIVNGIREVEAAMGDGIKRPSKSEMAMRRDARKSVIAARDIPPGKALQKEDIIIKRPAWGVHPSQAELIIGIPVKKGVKEDEPITWELLRKPGDGDNDN